MNSEDISDIAKEGTRGFANFSQIIKDILEPRNIIKKAKAQVKANLILESAKTGYTENEILAERRKKAMALREYDNLNHVVSLVNDQDELTDEKLNSISNDWLHKFINYASCVSDEEVQQLWAKILSGEVNTPGTFSLQTISTLSLIDKNIAIQINKLFQFIVTIENNLYIYYPTFEAPYLKGKQIYIDEDNLLQLESLGIIKINEGYWSPKLTFKNEIPINILYLDKTIVFTPKKPVKSTNAYLELGKIALTKIGKEIYQLNEQLFNKEIFDSIRYSLSKVQGSKVIY